MLHKGKGSTGEFSCIAQPKEHINIIIYLQMPFCLPWERGVVSDPQLPLGRNYITHCCEALALASPINRPGSSLGQKLWHQTFQAAIYWVITPKHYLAGPASVVSIGLKDNLLNA